MIIYASESAALFIQQFVGDSKTENKVFHARLPDRPYVSTGLPHTGKLTLLSNPQDNAAHIGF